MLAFLDNPPHMDSSLLVLALGVVLLAGLWLGVAFSRWRVRRRMSKHRRMGTKGEARAWKLLKKAGYTVVEEQPTAAVKVDVDGEITEASVRADGLVEFDGEVLVVEIKGGDEAADIRNRHTRRQLLEYTLAFDADSVLLVNAIQGTIERIRFPQLD